MSWDRGYIPKICSGTLPWRPAGQVISALLDGSDVRVLSSDTGAHAFTCLWRVPPGWSSFSKSWQTDADEQLFVLQGDLQMGGTVLRQHGFAVHPKGSEHQRVRSSGGAIVLAMWDGPIAGGEVSDITPQLLDTTLIQSLPTPVAGPVPGIVVKLLHTNEATGGMTLYMEIPAGWSEPRHEHHDCVEESFKLAGDISLNENGVMHLLTAGDYFFRPANIKHGDMYTPNGTASIIRFSATPSNHYGPIESGSVR